MNSTHQRSPLWHQPQSDYTQVLQLANGADPRTSPWGYFAWHHGFACGPITLGIFMWFESRDAMLQALVQTEVRLEYAGELGPEERTGILQMQGIADRIAGNDLDLQAACEALSKPFKFLSIEWIGRFGDLVSGDHPFALELREAFNERQAEDREAEAPIEAEDIEDFIAMITDWGI